MNGAKDPTMDPTKDEAKDEAMDEANDEVVTPLLVLLSPRASTPALHDLGLGLRGHLAAGLHAGGADVFAPSDPSIDGSDDPRSMIAGARGAALCRGPLRPEPTGYVVLELGLDADGHRGSLTLLDQHDFQPELELHFEGDDQALVEFFERALRSLLARSGVELPIGWPELLGSDDAAQAVASAFAAGESERLRNAGNGGPDSRSDPN